MGNAITTVLSALSGRRKQPPRISVAGAVLYALLISSVPAAAVPVDAPPLCDGHVPNMLGTPFDDAITGTDGNDVIQALGGDDVIEPGKFDRTHGNDRICGGEGNDVISVYRGQSAAIYGGPGNDLIENAGGIAGAYGGPGNDTLINMHTAFAGDGDDVLDSRGVKEVVELHGGQGDDALFGTNTLRDPNYSRDELWAGPGDDVLWGGDGGDYLLPGDGDDVVDAGRRSDQRSILAYPDSSEGLTVNLVKGIVHGDAGSDELAGHIDVVEGSPYPDTIRGGPGRDLLIGCGGGDRIFGLAGDDFLLGEGSGNEHCRGEPGPDVGYGGTGDDFCGIFDLVYGCETTEL